MRAAIAALLLLPTGCGLEIGGEQTRLIDDPLAPPPVARDGLAVDPLIVGDRLLAAGEPDAALDSYRRAALQYGLTADVKAAMAGANLALGRLGQAERQLRSVVAERPRDASAANNLGVVLLERGETSEAHAMFRTAFALQPSPEIQANLRLARAKLENLSYDDDQENAFLLTRRADGTFGLVPADQP
ncbi:MAG: hypothetical protein AAF919_15865 [Pseudomonadota bacterium]